MMASLLTGLAESISGIGVTLKPDKPTLLPLDEKIEEETLEDYDADEFYPMHRGDILGKRYEIVFKIGYGGYSTVWLARDKWYVSRPITMHIEEQLADVS